MPTLTWKDSRIVGSDVAPWDTTVMLVVPGTSIAEMVEETTRWCNELEGESKQLMIYCHGRPAFLQICKEGLYTWNLSKLSALRPFFDVVSIHACEVAKGVSGRAFCTKMAQVLAAWVDAAVKLQYNTGPATVYGSIDDKRYDGDYYRHLPSGERQGPLRN